MPCAVLGSPLSLGISCAGPSALVKTLMSTEKMSTENQGRRRVYKVVFLNQGEIFEIYAREVGQGSLFGFIEVEGLLFGERTQVVVDPSEERLKSEFKGVKRLYLPMHAIVRIDEVEKEGVSRVTAKEEAEGGGTVTSFPSPIYTPSGDSGKS